MNATVIETLAVIGPRKSLRLVLHSPSLVPHVLQRTLLALSFARRLRLLLKVNIILMLRTSPYHLVLWKSRVYMRCFHVQKLLIPFVIVSENTYVPVWVSSKFTLSLPMIKWRIFSQNFWLRIPSSHTAFRYADPNSLLINSPWLVLEQVRDNLNAIPLFSFNKLCLIRYQFAW